jgi:thiosulfate/3-mercaptopyruvate sulfurtransferase
MQPLITTGWLADNISNPNLVIFDATKYLPNEPKDGLLEYRRGHIPGARYFDIE